MHANTKNALLKVAASINVTVQSIGDSYVCVAGRDGKTELFASGRGWHKIAPADVEAAGSLDAALASAKAHKTPSAAFSA